jgi:hypothetical protein
MPEQYKKEEATTLDAFGVQGSSVPSAYFTLSPEENFQA